MKFTVSKPRNFREKKFIEETKELRFFCSTATGVLLLLEKDKISVTSLIVFWRERGTEKTEIQTSKNITLPIFS